MGGPTYDPVTWFDQHFHAAADTVLDFVGGDGIGFEGKRVADVGCGDGIIDLGVALKGQPVELVGFDLLDVEAGALLRGASAAGVAEELPAGLRFERSGPTALPAPDAHFDIVFSWSAFEHVTDPVGLLSEIRRVLTPTGCFFLQLWPFYGSEHGGHLWPHYDGPFPHHLIDDEDILREIEGKQATDPRRPAEDEYRSLNRISLEDLQRALLVSGFRIVKLELLTAAVHIPHQLGHMPLSDLGVGGVHLLAIPVAS